MTLLCVPIMVHEIDAALADCAEAKRLGAQIAEYRIDHMLSGSPEGSPPEDPDSRRETDEIIRLVRSSPLPCIVTCRPTFEGGHYDGDDASRVSLYERLATIDTPPRYIDVEHATISRSANIRQKVLLAVNHPGQLRGLDTALILSSHDFERRPADLTRRLLTMRDEPAAKILKIAYRARSLRDNLELFDMLRHTDRPMIALGMGEFGLMSRVLAPKFGAFLTFASLRDASATAPGQPTITEILQRFRFRSINQHTRVYGVLGWPVGHSLSPLIHNAGFEAVGHNGVYLPMPIAAPEGNADDNGAYESFKATVLELIEHDALDLSGASVTIPYKQALVRLAGEMGESRNWFLTPAAAAIGAANTIVVRRDPGSPPSRITIDNTDAPAIAACLAQQAGPVAGRHVVVLGAGGVARAAAYACAAAGANVTVTARRPEEADALATALRSSANLDIRTMPWESRHEAAADAFINCTPLGMQGGPAPDRSPIEPDALTNADPASIVYFDTVYTPLRTPMLALAERVGAPTIDGASMFVKQGAMQFQMWTDRPAPEDLFDGLVRARLNAT
ncbi:MAG: type I 3-dehydroquinate dehydratase [Phycisphaeraceae bacterium]|nr:type I 3-dehydroquinate dehydratase [Phycisphaeraceae bacterium]